MPHDLREEASLSPARATFSSARSAVDGFCVQNFILNGGMAEPFVQGGGPEHHGPTQTEGQTDGQKERIVLMYI